MKYIHYACTNNTVCNKYGYQPSVECSKHKCKFVIKTEIEVTDKSKTDKVEWWDQMHKQGINYEI